MRRAAALAFGWLVPGGVYLLKERYTQFAIRFVLVCACLAAGIALQGSNQWPAQSELQGVDGFTAATAWARAFTKFMAGAPCVIAGLAGYSQSFISGQVHEYGTVLLVAAGLINFAVLAEAK